MIHQLDFDPLATPPTDRNLDDRPSNDRPSNDRNLPRAIVPDWEQAGGPDLNSLDPNFLDPNTLALELALSPELSSELPLSPELATELATEIFDLPAFDPDAIDVTATEVIEVTEVGIGDAIASEISLPDPLETELGSVPEVLPVPQPLPSPPTHYKSHQTETLTYFQYYFESDGEDLAGDGLAGDGLAIENHPLSLRSPGIPMGFVGAGVLAFTLVSGLTIAETVKNQPLFASGNANQNPRKSNAERSTNPAIAPQMAQPETTAMAPLPSGLSNGLPNPSTDQAENPPSAQSLAAPQKMQVPLPPPLAANVLPPPPAIELPQLQPIAARLDAVEQAEIQTIAPPPPPKAMNFVSVAGSEDTALNAASNTPVSDPMTDSVAQRVRQNPASAQASPPPSALSAQTLPSELLTSLLPIAPTPATNSQTTPETGNLAVSPNPVTLTNSSGHAAIAPVEHSVEPTRPEATSNHQMATPTSATSPTPHSPIPHSPKKVALISPTQAATPQRITNESAIDPQTGSESILGIPSSNATTSDTANPTANHAANSTANHAVNHANDLTANHPTSLPTRGVNPPHVSPATAFTPPQELHDFLTAPAKASSQRVLTLLPLTLVAAKEALIQQRSAPLTLQPFTLQKLNQGDYLQAWRKSAGVETGAVIGIPAFGFIDYQRRYIILPIDTLQVETTQPAAIASQWQTESDHSGITQSGDAPVE